MTIEITYHFRAGAYVLSVSMLVVLFASLIVKYGRRVVSHLFYDLGQSRFMQTIHVLDRGIASCVAIAFPLLRVYRGKKTTPPKVGTSWSKYLIQSIYKVVLRLV